MSMLFGNNPISTLTVALPANEPTVIIDAADAGLFPSPTGDDYFMITIEDSRATPHKREICRCTSRNANLLMVQRAQEGTTALDFAVGTTTVSNRVTAWTMQLAALQPLADGKVYGQQLLTPGGLPNFVEVMTTSGGGPLSISGPLNIGVPAVPGMSGPTVNTGNVVVGGSVGFNLYWNGDFKYRSPGYGALWSMDPANGLLQALTAPSGGANADAPLTAVLRITNKGQLVSAGSALPAANDISESWIAQSMVLPAWGYLGWNLYNATDGWRQTAGGSSSMISHNDTGNTLDFYVNPPAAVGSLLPMQIAMQLGDTGSLTAFNLIYASKGVAFSSSNSWEFQAYTNASGDHIIAHRSGGWYDVWLSNGGATVWVRNNVNVMLLDNAGTLTLTGELRASGGVWASTDHNNGLVISGGRWMIWQMTANDWRLQFDSQTGNLDFVNPSNQVLWGVDSAGNMTCAGAFSVGQLTAAQVTVSGGVTTGTLHVNNNAQVDGNLGVSNNITAAGGVQGSYVHSSGSAQFDNEVICLTDIHAHDGFFVGADSTFGLYITSGERLTQYASNWYWAWQQTDGTLIWYASGQGNFLVANAATQMFYNNIGSIGAYGFDTFTDLRSMKVAGPTKRGLAEILRLNPIEFTQRGSGPRIGFAAQDVREVLPEAVREVGVELADGSGGKGDKEPSLALNYDALIPVLVNAAKEMMALIEALEVKIPCTPCSFMCCSC